MGFNSAFKGLNSIMNTSVEPDFVCLMFLMIRNEWQCRNVKFQVLSCFYSCNLIVIINKMFKNAL